MGSITATIQKEQNVIIRDTDSRVLLVNGIAGSGKTSVVLQRIAYLLYKYRTKLTSDDVLLLTPNVLFTNYINQVLPSLGEESPLQMTFDQLLGSFNNSQLSFTAKNSHIQQLSQQLSEFDLTADSFKNIKLNGKLVFDKATIKQYFDQTPKSMSLDKRITALTSVLINQVENGIEIDSKNGKIQAELTNLTDSEQEQIFGRIISPNSDTAFKNATKRMLQWRNQKLLKQLEQKNWLNINQIIKAVLQIEQINQLDYAFTKLQLLNLARKNLKFVMIDEIQDYSLDQVLFLITAFPNAQWTLVGDQFQSIHNSQDPLTFETLKHIFEKHNIKVTQRNLYTSYRSSGEITKAFVKHGSPELLQKINIIQVGGKKPSFVDNNDLEQLIKNLKSQIKQFDHDELSAIITSDSHLADSLNKRIDNIVLGTTTDTLPESGIVVLPLALAKGLEFDNVIVADIDSMYYRDKQFGENRIYTAFSRASKNLIVNTKKD